MKNDLSSPQTFQTKFRFVYEYVHERIMEGTYSPSRRLALTTLARELGISETPVREALRQLEAEGYVISVPHVGYRVSELTKEKISGEFIVRIALESLAMRLAFPKMDHGVIEMLKKLVLEMDEMLQNKEIRNYWKVNTTFHETICRLCNNETLFNFISQLWGRTGQSRAIFLLNPKRAKASNKEHRRILRHIIKGDLDEAVKAVEMHLNNALKAILSSELVKD